MDMSRDGKNGVADALGDAPFCKTDAAAKTSADGWGSADGWEGTFAEA